jgi:uncharacterized protein (DUF433 family)
MIATASGLGSWVQKNQGRFGGAPCIRNTGIRVHGLVEWRQLGLSDEEILEALQGLTAGDLESAWDYYEQNGAEIDQLIRQNNEAE